MGLLTVAGILLASAQPTSADVNTISVDNTRQAWRTDEASLPPANLTGIQQTFNTPVSGAVLAQPVVVGSTVVVATENDVVYGIDRNSGAVQWNRTVGTPESSSTIGCVDSESPTFGVTSTPVVDPATGIVYLMARTWDGSNTASAAWFMYALNASTGAVQPGWPVQISGAASNDSTTGFDAALEFQRPGLLLLGGRVYAGFASVCDLGDYRGWVVGVSTATRSQTRWVDEANPNGGEANILGGIWQSGGGPASDSILASDPQGRIFLATGNGTNPPVGRGTQQSNALGNSLLRLQVQSDGTLAPVDRFTPANADQLSNEDLDFGSAGPAVLPSNFGGVSKHLLFVGSKSGEIYLLDRDNLGGRAQGPNGSDAVVAEIQGGSSFSHPAVWGGDGGYVYLTQATTNYTGNNLGVYRVVANGSSGATLSLAGTTPDTFGYGSGSPVITSNGSASGSAILWAIDRTSESGGCCATAELRAYNPVPVNGTLQLLWHTPIGVGAKFTPPATDGNQVYVGTQDGHVQAFSASPPPLSVIGAEGSDGALWVRSSGGPYTSLGGVLAGAPAIAAVPQAAAPASPIYVATGSDNALYVRSNNQGWQRLSNSFTFCIDNPAVTVTGGAGSATLTVACQGSDHALWVAQGPVNAGGLPTLGGWSSLGGVLAAGPAVAPVGGNLTFVVDGTDGHVWSRTLSSGWTSMAPWACLGHPSLAASGSTTTFACDGTDHTLWFATNGGSGWSAATSAGGVLVDGPDVAASSGGTTFFVQGSDNAVWQTFAPPGGTPTGWFNDGGIVRQGAGAEGLG